MTAVSDDFVAVQEQENNAAELQAYFVPAVWIIVGETVRDVLAFVDETSRYNPVVKSNLQATEIPLATTRSPFRAL